MKNTDNLKITGAIASWKLLDKDGNVKEEGGGHNLITDVGKNRIAALLGGTSTSLMTHIAIGSDSTAPAAGNTALGTELARVAITSTNVSTNTVTYTATFGAGVGTGTVAEAGLFDASSGGTMLSRSTSVSLVKGASDSLLLTWVITVS